MSENAYHDLWVELMMTLQSALSAEKPPKNKTDWKHIRQVVDPRGNALGKIKSSRRHMSIVPSRVEGAGERLVRLKKQGWLLEAERVPKGITRRSVLISDSEAEQWLERNGWKPVKGGPKGNPTRYEVQGDEAVLVTSGYAIVSGPPDALVSAVNEAHVECEGIDLPVEDLDDPDLAQGEPTDEMGGPEDDAAQPKQNDPSTNNEVGFGPAAEAAEVMAGVNPAGVNVLEDLVVIQTTT